MIRADIKARQRHPKRCSGDHDGISLPVIFITAFTGHLLAGGERQAGIIFKGRSPDIVTLIMGPVFSKSSCHDVV